jgi:hypothetical protein
MDINVDQAVPRKDMVIGDDGKSTYVDPVNSKFDIDKFNRHYEQYRDRRRINMKENMEKKLAELNKEDKIIPVYRQSIPKIILDIKDSLFNILDDLLQGKLDTNTLTKNNRLFYLGITFIVIAIFMYVYSVLIDDNDDHIQPTNIMYIEHIHKIIKN